MRRGISGGWNLQSETVNRSLTYRGAADFVVLSYGVKGRYKRPLTSRDLTGLWKEKRYRRNMMFLFARHSAGLLSKNFVKQSFTKFLESQLHGSRRKSYLSAPFFFHLRYGWLVRGRLYMPDQRHESHHKICNSRYGTPVMGWMPIKEVDIGAFNVTYNRQSEFIHLIQPQFLQW